MVYQLSSLMTQGDFYALGQSVQVKAATADKVLDELLNYLVTNTYSKLPYIKVRQAEPLVGGRAGTAYRIAIGLTLGSGHHSLRCGTDSDQGGGHDRQRECGGDGTSLQSGGCAG